MNTTQPVRGPILWRVFDEADEYVCNIEGTDLSTEASIMRKFRRMWAHVPSLVKRGHHAAVHEAFVRYVKS